MVKKVSLEELIKKKESMIVVFGVFLAVLAISFSELNQLNSDYAGYLAIFSFIILAVIGLEIFNVGEDKEMTPKASIFVISLFAIGIILYQIISTSFKNQTTTTIYYVLHIVSLIIGVWLSSKLINLLNKTKKHLWLHILILIIALGILLNLKGFMGFVSGLFINRLSPVLMEYLGTGFVTFIGIIIFYGIFVSGYEVLIKKWLWKKLKKALNL